MEVQSGVGNGHLVGGSSLAILVNNLKKQLEIIYSFEHLENI